MIKMNIKIASIILGVMVFCSFAIYVYRENIGLLCGISSETIAAFSSNITAGFISSIIIILLIDDSIRAIREKERAVREKLAERLLRRSILDMINLLIDMYKASLPEEDTSKYETYGQFLNSGFANEIRRLDFLKETHTRSIWLELSAEKLKLFKSEIEKILSIFIAFMPMDFLNILVDMLTDKFLNYVIAISELKVIHSKPLLLIELEKDALNNFVYRLRLLIDYYEKHYFPIYDRQIDINWDSATLRPRTGSGRFV